MHKEEGILECKVYSIENSLIAKKEQMDIMGISDVKLYGRAINAIINFNALGDVLFFIPNKVEIDEGGDYEEIVNFQATYVEFKEELTFIIMMPFEEFKKLYFDYKNIKVDGD